jgi:DNA repair exonuclease SbcCD ATPase subunit
MILLKTIELNNFFSHKKTIINIEQDARLLIDGKSGCGKSSIVEALVWCFYGKGRTDNRSIIKRGASYASVSIVLVDGKIEYKVERHVSSVGKQTINVFKRIAGEKAFKLLDIVGTKSAQSFIEEELLKSSYLLFINSVIYPQDNSENFIKQTATKRKDILLEIINASMFDGYLDTTKDQLASYTSKLSSKEQSIASLNDQILRDNTLVSQIGDVDSKIKTLEEKLSASSIKRDELVSRTSEMNVVYNSKQGLILELSELTSKRESLQLEINRVNDSVSSSSIESINEDIDKLNSNINDIEIKITEEEKKESAAMEWDRSMLLISQGRPAFHDYDKDISDINKQLIEVLSDDVETCPELHKPCPLFQKQKDEKSSFWKERLSVVKQEKESYVEQLSLYMNKEEKLGARPILTGVKAELRKNVAEYKDKLLNLNNKKKELENINSIMSGLSKDLEYQDKAINNIKDKIELCGNVSIEIINSYRDLLDEASDELEAINKEINQASVDRRVKSEAMERVTSSQVEINKIKEEIKEDIEIRDGLLKLKEIFGSKGVKSMIIDEFIPVFEDNINNVLSRLSDFRIKLDTQKSTVSGESVIDGLFITIVNDTGEEMMFENYSGGEKLKITVAICEALSSVQRVGFRVLDELFVGLDDESINSFADIITSLSDKFSQFLCISHIPSIKELFNDQLLVVKQAGTSFIHNNK